ncbi:MAG: 8-oxo-dGTP pyrophosphatase MutT (NUDIX family) [Candidatus Pseudothioglobus sp.]|jgi:8-oxo-dGTP pyrophosphatase MutT (NUDIX family)
MSSAANAVPTAVPAATILMLRDGVEALEVFMVVRHHQIDFASGALVFPGGKVDAGDGAVRDRCHGVDDADDVALSLQAGAIREAFEECGILLAREQGSTALVSANRLMALEPYRNALVKHDISLRDFLVKEDLILACDLLQPYAHWVTPTMMPKRFDTWFYLAQAPADHLAIHDGHESVDSVWIAPDSALEGAASGKYTVIFPTRLNIEMLAESNTVASAFEMARTRNLVTVLPWTEQRDDGVYLCIPDNAGYHVSEEKMPDRQG